MSNQTAKSFDAEEERKQRLDEMVAEHGPNWSEEYKPGTFGCHELLDRTSLAGDFVEEWVLAHPACALNREWYALAEQAVAALRRLYQQVGAEQLGAENQATGNA